MILPIHCSIFSVAGLVTTSWLSDSWLHRLLGYWTLLLPNSEGEKTNVSVRYLGCWGWIAARSWEQDRGRFLPHGRFSVVLSFLDYLHPPSIAACRINSQSSKAGNQMSHAQSIRYKNTVMFMVVRQYYHSTKYYRATTTGLKQEFRIGSEPYVLHTWFWSTG